MFVDVSGAVAQRIFELEHEVKRLQAEKATLEQALGIRFEYDPVKSKGMPKTMRKMLGMLLARELCNRTNLRVCTPDGVEDRTVEVHLSRLRRFLRKSFGVEIVLHRDEGWSLRPEDKQLLRKELGVRDGDEFGESSALRSNPFDHGCGETQELDAGGESTVHPSV